jgi:hypothetical protein
MFDLISGYPMTINMIIPVLLTGTLIDAFKILLDSPISKLVAEEKTFEERLVHSIEFAIK